MRLLSKNGAILCLMAVGSLISVSASAADCVNGVNTATCTVPAGATAVTIEAWGGGGGGGGAGGMFMLDGGGGGGGGSYCKATFLVTAGSTLTVNVGSGGSGGALRAAGTAGMPSSVSGLGLSGLQANGGSAGAPNRVAGAGGTTAGCTAVGAIRFTGGNGFGSPYGGGGGGSATSTTNGTNGFAGAGGAGEGNGGDGGENTGSNGSPGFAPGGGGGGGQDNTGLTGATGGLGRILMTFVIGAGAVTNTTPVPTLGEWSTVLLSGLIALAMWISTRKYRG